MRGVSFGVIVGLVVAIGFFALRSSPRLMEVAWLPHWLSSWADAYGVGRNVLAFGVLGLAVFASVGSAPLVIIGASLFATLLEVAQLWIPGRWFDWKDIVASLGGLAIAWVVARLARRGFAFWVVTQSALRAPASSHPPLRSGPHWQCDHLRAYALRVSSGLKTDANISAACFEEQLEQAERVEEQLQIAGEIEK